MINPIMPNIYMPSILNEKPVSSVLQMALDTSAINSLTISESGFTEKGLALLALLALMDDEDNPLNLTQRMILLSLLLSMSNQEDIVNFSTLNKLNQDNTLNSISTVAYNDIGGAIMQTAITGTLFSANI